MRETTVSATSYYLSYIYQNGLCELFLNFGIFPFCISCCRRFRIVKLLNTPVSVSARSRFCRCLFLRICVCEMPTVWFSRFLSSAACCFACIGSSWIFCITLTAPQIRNYWGNKAPELGSSPCHSTSCRWTGQTNVMGRSHRRQTCWQTHAIRTWWLKAACR